MSEFTGIKLNGTTHKIKVASPLSLTAAAANWTNGAQTLTATGVTASNNIIVGIGGSLTSEQHQAAVDAAIVCTAQAANSITLTAFGTIPEVDIPVNVLILT